MQRIFITHIISEPFIKKYGMSVAACNFSFNLMGGGVFDKTYSILGTNIGGTLESEIYSDSRYKLFYNNYFRNKNRICKQIASIIEQWQVFKIIPRSTSVWLYNVTTLNFILYILLSIFKRSVQINIIQLDFTPVENGFGLNQLFLKIFNKCHGNIRLADSPLFNNKNSITLPGVVPKNSGSEPKILQLNNRYLLSGVLNECISQFSMVVEVFSQLPNCELHITGVIEDESIVTEYANKYSNIFWHGNLSYDDYLDILHSCSYQLSTRNPNFLENQCNFPSKIIEALLHNRIVISTIEYKQIESVKYFKVESDIVRFKKCIECISKMPEIQLINYANQGKRVSELYSTKVWNEAMLKIEGYEK